MKTRLTTISMSLGVILAALSVPCANAQVAAPAPMTLPARWSYAAKFVCGYSPIPTSLGSVPKEPPVKKGNYATVVNIHNTAARDVTIHEKSRAGRARKVPEYSVDPAHQAFLR